MWKIIGDVAMAKVKPREHVFVVVIETKSIALCGNRIGQSRRYC